MDFTNTAERSQVGYWIVKKIEKCSYLVPSVWERVYFSPSWYSASVKGRSLFCLHIGLLSQTALAFDLFFVGSAFDMPTDSKRFCSQRVGGTIGYGSWISIFQPLDYLTTGFCD